MYLYFNHKKLEYYFYKYQLKTKFEVTFYIFKVIILFFKKKIKKKNKKNKIIFKINFKLISSELLLTSGKEYLIIYLKKN